MFQHLILDTYQHLIRKFALCVYFGFYRVY